LIYEDKLPKHFLTNANLIKDQLASNQLLNLLMHTELKNPNSKYKPYFDILPQNLYNFPIFYNSSELQFLQGTCFLSIFLQYIWFQIYKKRTNFRLKITSFVKIRWNKRKSSKSKYHWKWFSQSFYLCFLTVLRNGN